MKKILGVIVLIVIMFVISFLTLCCTSKDRAKKWGGTTKIELQVGNKLVNATWKDTNLWLLTRAMHPREYPERYEFKEDSSWGLLEGKIIIIEKK